MLHLKQIYVLDLLYSFFFTAIAEAIEKWKAEKEARLAGGGGAKELEEEEEYIYAVKDDEVMVKQDTILLMPYIMMRSKFVPCGSVLTDTLMDCGHALS